MSTSTIFVTEEWLKKLRDELEHLKNVKRVEIAEQLKEAISFWDLSENSEYEDARNEQAAVELRIADLEEQLKHVEIIKGDSKKWQKVIMGVTIVLENTSTKVKESYKIVGSTESDIMSKIPMISNDSPVGKAVLGKKIWSSVTVKAPSGNFEYKILEVK